MKNIFRSFVLGTFIGMCIALFFSFINSPNGEFYISTPGFMSKFQSENMAVLVSYTMYGLIGVSSMLLDTIFKKVDNLLVATIIHYIAMNITIVLFGMYLNWWNTLRPSIFVIILAIYAVIYIINYINTKKKLEVINKNLN